MILLISLLCLDRGAAVLIGSQQATYTFNHSVVLLPNYKNNGFKQEIDSVSGEIRVEVENTPLRSRIKALPVPQFDVRLKSLEIKLRDSSAKTMAQQVAVILNWLRQNIEYSQRAIVYHHSNGSPASISTNRKTVVHDGLDDRALQVLLNRRADCVGLSELAVAIFKKMGINSRFVTGVAFKKDDPARLRLEGDVLHRWIEIHYPDVGWVFSDPSGKVNYVEATYIVLGIWGKHPIEPMVKNLFGKELEILIFQNGFKLLNVNPELDGRVGVRPNMLFK